MKVGSGGDSGRSAGVSPAVAGASRSRAKEVLTSWEKGRSKLAQAGCPRHSGRDARATSNGLDFTLMSRRCQGSN
jgi:hypothetical protein